MTETRQYIYPWQSDEWQQLCSKVDTQRLPHALLCQGNAGCGIEDFVKIFSAGLLCKSPQEGIACGECKSCQLFMAGSHPDFKWITPELNKEGKRSSIIKIDQIRNLLHFVSQTAMQGGRKIIVLDLADCLNINAANALLKCLEEPGDDTVFLLISFQAYKILPTIRSRCQQVDFPAPEHTVASDWLTHFVQDEATRKSLLSMSANAPLLAREWFENNRHEDILSLEENLIRVYQQDLSVLQLTTQWLKQEPLLILQWWWRWLMLELKKVVTQEACFITQQGLAEKHILLFMDKLQTCKGQLESSANPNPQLLLESVLIDWQNLAPKKI